MVYIFLAEGFEETEAVTPIDLLKRAGFHVITVGVTGKTVTGSHGIPVVCDITTDEMTTDGLEMIILPGGMPGTKNLEADASVIECVKYCADKGIFIGAICAAPTILGKLGLLAGRKAVCYPGMEKMLIGRIETDEPAVTDGTIITSKGAGTALDFSCALISALGADADRIASNIVWKR